MVTGQSVSSLFYFLVNFGSGVSEDLKKKNRVVFDFWVFAVRSKVGIFVLRFMKA